MVEKLDLPFRLLADERAEAASAWKVYDPKARIAIPSLFLVMPDLSVPYRYVGEDYVDRPALDELFAALDATTPGPARRLERAAPAGSREPLDLAKRPIPLEELPPYFRGGSYAVTALAARSGDPVRVAEAQLYRELVTQFIRAATETIDAKRRASAAKSAQVA